jgi:uncharacterized membrane protein
MINEILILIGLTLLPFLELRASIPYGILVLGMDWISVFLICVIANIILGPIVYIFLDKVVHLFLRINWIDKCYQKYVERTQRRIRPYVEKYGLLGVSIFIGVPLPGSGSYTGALGSYLLGIKFKRFVLANVIGVLIAGVLVTIISLTGGGVFNFIIR